MAAQELRRRDNGGGEWQQTLPGQYVAAGGVIGMLSGRGGDDGIVPRRSLCPSQPVRLSQWTKIHSAAPDRNTFGDAKEAEKNLRWLEKKVK